MSPGSPLLPAGAPCILLVRLRSIGDAVLMMPLVAAIRRARPEARLVAVLEPGPAALLDGQPGLDATIVAGRGPAARLRALRRMRAERAAVALDLHGGPTAALLTRFSAARVRIGLLAYRSRGAYDVRLPSPYKGAARDLTLHTVDSNLAIARALGADPEPGLGPRLVPTAAGEAEAASGRAAAGLPAGEAYAVIHPGAALRSKTWPIARFAAVAAGLAGDGLRVALVTPPGAPPGGDEATLPLGVHPLPPLSLGGLLAVLAGARVFVGNDSGPAHMAAAVGVPTVTVFGSQDPRVWQPYGAHHRVLWRGLPCSPCRGFTCANPHPFECLDAIPVDEVLGAARAVLSRG